MSASFGNAVLRPLLSADRIASRVAELGREISAVYRDQEVSLVPILSGALVFSADLVRHLPLDMVIHMCALHSYQGTQPGQVNWRLPLPDTLSGQHVLVVDDILDTGQTLGRVCDAIRRQRPASLRTCVLLSRGEIAPGGLAADFLGFRIDRGFVVGYGLDFNGRYRNLDSIAILDPQPEPPA